MWVRIDHGRLSLLESLARRPRAFLAPRELGATSHSYHTKQLTALLARGLVERSRRNPGHSARASYKYRITESGVKALAQCREHLKRYKLTRAKLRGREAFTVWW